MSCKENDGTNFWLILLAEILVPPHSWMRKEINMR